ncbi:hypothetical protein Tco_0955998 [Tanacetum coccineum]|uniref:Uncharacterized protein n=1 Tax=Tanacetum coccineum TaxID=301880 RepID=A0ABQ5E8Q5_9ASTR
MMMMMTGVAREGECIGDPIDRPVSHLFAFAGQIHDDDVINGGGDGDVWGWSMAVVVSRLWWQSWCAGD